MPPIIILCISNFQYYAKESWDGLSSFVAKFIGSWINQHQAQLGNTPHKALCGENDGLQTINLQKGDESYRAFHAGDVCEDLWPFRVVLV